MGADGNPGPLGPGGSQGNPTPDLTDPDLLDQIRTLVDNHPQTTTLTSNLGWTDTTGVLQGQIFWDPAINFWTVRAHKLSGMYTRGVPVSVHVSLVEEIPNAITKVIAQLG